MTDKKSPATSEMQRYMELDAQEKAIKAEKEKLRDSVLEQFRSSEGGSYEGISFSTRQDIRIKKNEFYTWVKANWPDLLPGLLVKEIDYEEFEKAYAMGLLDYEQLPEDTYSYAVTEVVSIQANRRGKAPVA